MPTIRVTVLIALSGIAAVIVGAYIGAGRAERRIAYACVTEQHAWVLSVQIECGLAPGWREHR